MEKKFKIIIAIAVIVIVAIVGIVVFANSDKEIPAESCVGTWEIANNDNYYYHTIILYQGGTGKRLGTNNNNVEQSHPITWEIKNNTLNINNGTGSIDSFAINKDYIKSVDGQHTYNKAK